LFNGKAAHFTMGCMKKSNYSMKMENMDSASQHDKSTMLVEKCNDVGAERIELSLRP
jgi:hypothetical protein